ncbi:MAG TPA: methyltransferase [Chryseolinea sp.]
MSLTETPRDQEGSPEKNGQTQNSVASSLRELIMGFRNTQLISVAAKLNLAEHLKSGPKTAEELSEITHTNPAGLHRLLRALTSLGIFEEMEDGTFSATTSGALLRDDTPGSLRSMAVLYGAEWLWQAYAELSYSVESGNTAFDFVHGQSFYVYLQQHPAADAVFQKAMSDYSNSEASAIIQAYDFSAARMIIDVGGGHGAFLSSVLKANPHASGVVFDLPSVIEKYLADLTSASRDLKISYVPGDFFNCVPGGGDTYLLKSVLHNWDNKACIEILKNVGKVMTAQHRILVIERVIPSGNEKSEAKLFDINMLVVTGGRERTQEEYKKLFHAAGFRLTRIISTKSPVSIIEACPVPKQVV